MAIALLGLSGCRSPLKMQQAADRAAYDAVSIVRSEMALDDVPFSVEMPGDTLRRRLIEKQLLPATAPLASRPEELPAVKRWKPEYIPPSADALEETALSDQEFPVFGLNDVLHLAARGSREYQTRKERLFLTALALDLEEEEFRGTVAGMLAVSGSEDLSGEDDVRGAALESSLTFGKVLKGGMQLAAGLTVDVVRLLTAPKASALGLQLDTSITVPLGRGAGRHIAAEQLTQAQRDLLYGVMEFEHYRAGFSVDVAARYLRVLSLEDQVLNAAENYQRLTVNARRARRLAAAGRLPEIQVDQAVQEQLRAWNRWINARRQAEDAMDEFKISMGLSPDSEFTLDRDDLAALNLLLQERLPFLRESGITVTDDGVEAADAPVELPEPSLEDGGPYEMPMPEAIELALEHRLDLWVSIASVEDALRQVVVAADALGADFSLRLNGVLGERRAPSSAGRGDSRLAPDEGAYGALLRLDPPLRRVKERNAFRRSQILLEQAVRSAQEAEDRVKQQVRGNLRALLQARESLRIQSEAVRIAERRVESSNLFLEAGRAAIRDVLEAQDALLSARNALTAAMVEYRMTEVELQKNIGLLRVDSRGQWIEMDLANE